ncbi:MAG: FeoB-associated Cys-rich membrane protein [Verrucomicrobiae bacterium]|nr:FeoB-associated Cys-rich membrane protein [Verrucomicrobiae bacterium]
MQEILVGLIVGAAAVWLVRRVLRSRHSSCGSCSGCGTPSQKEEACLRPRSSDKRLFFWKERPRVSRL